VLSPASIADFITRGKVVIIVLFRIESVN